MNIIMVAVFILHTLKGERLQVVGINYAVYILVFAAVLAQSTVLKRDWWIITFPRLLAVFLIAKVARTTSQSTTLAVRSRFKRIPLQLPHQYPF